MVDYSPHLSSSLQDQVNRFSTGQYMSQNHASPHLTHLDPQNSTASTPSPPYPQYAQPVMSQQNNNQSRQPTSYPSPHSYPSPSMSAYAYPAPNQTQTVEPYRASPTGSHVSLPSLNLPPIRSIDPRQQQQQQAQAQAQQPQQQQQQQQQPPPPPQQGGPVPMGSPLPPPVAQMGQYYHNQGQSLPPPQHANVTSSPHSSGMRYPLPADGRIMSGGRHKKEIKRRTKTGCLTCRKRRIKCDEAHPACRNCQKSKRECLGYDPIFKTQPGPAAIQPAPSSAPSMQATSASSSPYPPPPQGYMPAASQGYAPPLSTGASSPGSSVEPYDYAAAIDPALEGAGPSQMAVPPASYDGTQGFRLDLKAVLDVASPYSSGASELHNQRSGDTPVQNSHVKAEPLNAGIDGMRTSPAYTSTSAKRTKIDDLLLIGGIPPPPITRSTSIAPSTYDEIKNIYTTVYAPHIDKFLETRWFQLRGLPRLLNDSRLCDQFACLVDRFNHQRLDDPHATAITQSLEAGVIWGLMNLCRTSASGRNGANGQGNFYDVHDGVDDAVKRLDIFENLVSGQYMDSEPPSSDAPRNGSALEDQLRSREREFWRLMGRFLTLRDDEASSAKEIDDTLALCRGLLDSREGRDVMYSIAIARHIGQRMAEFPDNLPHPVGNDEQDARTKLFVAKKFIEDEAMGKGTSQVIQRLCGMAMRSWTIGR